MTELAIRAIGITGLFFGTAYAGVALAAMARLWWIRHQDGSDL